MFSFARRHRRPAPPWRFTPNGLELLERRDLLSGTPPTVVKVEVASTSWSAAFMEYLAPSGTTVNGYAIPVGSTAQSASLTWSNIDQIIITFSEDVDVDLADLSLTGVNTAVYQFADFRYDPIGHFAIWTLATPLDKDRIRLDLDANGIDPVRDLNANVLDGEWTNNASVTSGDTIAGGDFHFNLNVLPTDVNNTGNITYLDYVYIRQLDGKTTTSPGYNAKRDIDGSGTINSSDWQEALDRALEVLPSGSPAGTNNDAPTTKGFNLVNITDVSTDVAVSFLSRFDDLEDGSSGLTYSILSNSNAALFDTATMNSNGDGLILNAAAGASGRATIVVRATDSNGLTVDSVVTVDVNRENQSPEIINFNCGYAGANTWIVTGQVLDADDDVSKFIVEFSGVFVTRAAVNEYGEFEFSVILNENQTGAEHAVTYDPHGEPSNMPFSTIFVT